MHIVLDPSPVGCPCSEHSVLWTCSHIWDYWFRLRTFYFILFLGLVPSLLFLASPSLPLLSDPEHRRSFYLRARCRIATTIYFLSSIWTPTAFHIRRPVMSPAGHSRLDLFVHLFPTSHPFLA